MLDSYRYSKYVISLCVALYWCTKIDDDQLQPTSQIPALLTLFWCTKIILWRISFCLPCGSLPAVAGAWATAQPFSEYGKLSRAALCGSRQKFNYELWAHPKSTPKGLRFLPLNFYAALYKVVNGLFLWIFHLLQPPGPQHIYLHIKIRNG